VGGIRDDAGFNRIQVNVAERLQEVTVVADEARMIAPLEQMPRGGDSELKSTSVTGCDRLHEPPERYLAHLSEQVHVIRHPAVAVDACVVSLQCIARQAAEQVTIGIVAEYVLTMISAQRYVIEAARHVYAGSSRHRPRFKKDAEILRRTAATTNPISTRSTKIGGL
jgi:hypothetical protein